MSKTPVRGAAALALALLAAAPLVAEQSRTLDHRVPAAGTVRLQNLAGPVELIGAAGDAVTIEARVHADAGDPAATERLLSALRWVEAERGWTLSWPVRSYQGFAYPREDRSTWAGSTSTTYLGERVRIHGKPSRGVPVLWADLTIGIPAGSRVEVRNVVGGVKGGRLAGELTIDTGSGDVKLAAFAGRLLVDTGSGDVEVAAASGTVEVDTGSGDVRLDHVDCETAVVDTGSGDVLLGGGRADDLRVDTGSGEILLDGVELVTLEADTGSGDVTLRGDLSTARALRIDTGSGDVRIAAGPAFDFDLTTDLGSGEVDVRYGDTTLRRSGREVVGAVRGDGRTRIHVDTGSGDCIVGPAGR